MPQKRYSIRDLDKDVRRRILEDWRTKIWDYHDTQQLSDLFKEILSERGFSEVDVGWSLGYCQGDGVCFWGHIDPVDFFKWVFSGEKLAKPYRKIFKPFVKLQDHVGIRVTHEDRYCHWNSMSVMVEVTGREEDFIPKEMRNSVMAWVDRRRDVPKGPKEWRPGTGIPRHIQVVIDQAEKDYKDADRLAGDLEKALDEWVKETSKFLEKIGYEEIEYRQSDENIIEHLEGNDYWFDEEGEEL